METPPHLSSDDCESLTNLDTRESYEETSDVDEYLDDAGCKNINEYRVIKELGRGAHGKVKLCVDESSGVLYVSTWNGRIDSLYRL